MTGPSRGKAIAYTLALFLAGGICGAVMMAHVTSTPQSLKVGRTAEIAVKIQEKLNTSLALTPEQLQKFQPLIDKAAAELEASHKDCLDRISLALTGLHNQIAAGLTDEQKAKLANLETERRATMLQKYNYQLGATNRSTN